MKKFALLSLLLGLLSASALVQTKVGSLAAPMIPAPAAVTPVAPPTLPAAQLSVAQPSAIQPPLNQPAAAAPTDPFALRAFSVAELSRKADIIVRATVGAPLTIKQGDQNWRVYPLDILETLAGDAQAIPKIKYQDKGAALEKPALWIYADAQQAPTPPNGEAVLFLYKGQLDSPLVGYSQGAFVVNNSRVQGLPAGTPGADQKAAQPQAAGLNVAGSSVAGLKVADAKVAPVPAPAAPGATPGPEKPPLTAQGNPVNTAVINSSAAPAPQAGPVSALGAPPAASGGENAASPGNTSTASLPPSIAPTSAASAAGFVNGDLKPPVVPAPPTAPSNAETVAAPLAAGQLLLPDFRTLVLSSRSKVNP